RTQCQSMSANSAEGYPGLLCRLPDISGHSVWSISMQDLVRFLLERCAAPTDSHGNLARGEEVMVVFSVTDRNCIVHRETKCVHCLPQTGALAYRLRQNHQATTVEQQYERQFEFPDHRQNPRSRTSIRFYDALASIKLNSAEA